MKTYILYQPHQFIDYLLKPLADNPSFCLHRHVRNRSLISNIKRWIRVNLPGHRKGLWGRDIFTPEYYDFMKKIQPGDKVVFWAVGNWKDIRMVAEEAGASRFSSLLWDPMRQICHYSSRELARYPGIMEKLGIRVSTFDSGDAAEYGFNYVGQVGRIPDSGFIPVKGVEEVLFIGAEKHRAPILEHVASRLEKEGVGFTCMVLPGKHYRPGKYPRIDGNLMKEPIPYERLVEYSLGAECLLDIVQPGQTGCTMRTVEAVMFGKKLITNNPAVKAEAFFNPSNVYILEDGDSETRSIREFLEIPYEQPDKRLIENLDIRKWIECL